jgi:GDSL-like Lipase/Acylhydrolase family
MKLSPTYLLTTLFTLALSLGLSADPVSTKKEKKTNPSLVPVTDVAGLPRVLLIGDSISMGYTIPVRTLLADKANVHRPLMNCGHTATGLAQIDTWLATGGADKKWDVIHFNWGLHDLKYIDDKGDIADVATPGAKQQISPEDYRKNLTALTERLKATGAKLIWRNTTPVPEGTKGRIANAEQAYNKIAAEVMTAAGVPTHDLASFVTANQSKYQLPANVHFSPEGSDALAAEVAREILAALGQ